MIRREAADGVCVLALAQPQRGNALSEAMVEALAEGVEAAIADPAVHTLVLAGEGRNFCTGFDLSELPRGRSAARPGLAGRIARYRAASRPRA